jgi:hypothetical protein
MNSKLIAAVTLAATTIGLVATPAMAKKPKLTGEAKLAKMLEGREAGKPTNCLPLGPTQESTIIDKTAIVYRYGNTLYVNRPSNAESLDDDDILLTRQTTGQLCRLDSVQLIDRTSRFYSGFVALQDFVPYKKVVSAK